MSHISFLEFRNVTVLFFKSSEICRFQLCNVSEVEFRYKSEASLYSIKFESSLIAFHGGRDDRFNATSISSSTGTLPPVHWVPICSYAMLICDFTWHCIFQVSVAGLGWPVSDFQYHSTIRDTLHRIFAPYNHDRCGTCLLCVVCHNSIVQKRGVSPFYAIHLYSAEAIEIVSVQRF